MHIGQKIKQLMSDNNFDVARLALRLGKSKQAIYDLLDKEDVNTSLLRDLSEIFGCSISVFFEEPLIEKSVIGNSNVYVGGNQSGVSVYSNSQEIVEKLESEKQHLKLLLESKDKIIEEKERLIGMLTKGLAKQLVIDVYSVAGAKRIRIIDIENIVPRTGLEKEFIGKINVGPGVEYPCCTIYLTRGRVSHVMQDSRYIWRLINDKLITILR